MTVARIDAADTKQIEKFRGIGIEFGMLPQVLVVKNGELFRYDGLYSSFENLLFMVQHLITPLVKLKYEDHIFDFLDTSEPALYEEDYKNGLLQTGLIQKNFGGYVQSIGFNTRAVAFFFEQKEYEEEITALTRVAEKLSVRMNLRIAIVTDKDLINKMKKKYPQYFEELTKSTMLLKRYDGEVFKLNLSTAETVSYNWWINSKSKKPIDNLNHGAYQLGEVSNMPMIVLYVSFDSTKPKQFKKCTDAIAVLNNLAP